MALPFYLLDNDFLAIINKSSVILFGVDLIRI
jgi:hypothetical protein